MYVCFINGAPRFLIITNECWCHPHKNLGQTLYLYECYFGGNLHCPPTSLGNNIPANECGSLSSLFLSSEEENLTGCDCGTSEGSILIQFCNSCGWIQLSTIETSLLHQTPRRLKKYQQSSVSTSLSGQLAERTVSADTTRLVERLMKLQWELGHCDKLCFIK